MAETREIMKFKGFPISRKHLYVSLEIPNSQGDSYIWLYLSMIQSGVTFEFATIQPGGVLLAEFLFIHLIFSVKHPLGWQQGPHGVRLGGRVPSEAPGSRPQVPQNFAKCRSNKVHLLQAP